MIASPPVVSSRGTLKQLWTLAAVILMVVGLGGCCSATPIERVEEVRAARNQLIDAGKGIKKCDQMASGFAEPRRTDLMKPVNELSRLYDEEVGGFKKVCTKAAEYLRGEAPTNTGSLLTEYTRDASARYARLQARARDLETTINEQLKGGRSDSVELSWGGLRVNPISLIGSLFEWFEKREWQAQRPFREYVAVQLEELARTTPTYAESSAK